MCVNIKILHTENIVIYKILTSFLALILLFLTERELCYVSLV